MQNSSRKRSPAMHRDVFERLMARLKQLRSARELVSFIAAQDWSAVGAAARLIALHEINQAIMRLRERNGLPPIDDALPGERPTAFQLIPHNHEFRWQHQQKACREPVSAK